MIQEQNKLGKNHIRIHYDFNNIDANFKLISDRNKLNQVLINLLKNALKFTESGEIKVWVEEIVVEQRPFLKFFVQDSGIGIPEDKRELVFDIFRQADDTHSRKHDGVGIGLTVVRKLVLMLGGEVGVDSTEGMGSTFYFTICNCVNKSLLPESAQERPVKESTISKANILVVEDDDASYYLLELLLMKQVATVSWAKNGREALDLLLGEHNYDIILMDLNMPLLDGYETTVLILEKYPDQIIIAQSAYAISGDKEKALAVGCSDYLTKPIDAKKLESVLGKYLMSNNTEV